jgi:membrane protein
MKFLQKYSPAMVLDRLYRSHAVQWLLRLADRLKPPGFDGLSLLAVGRFFFRGLFDGTITTRASSIAFKFFMAIFPAIIFFFTLIPYIPVKGFHETLMDLLQSVLPEAIVPLAYATIDDIVSRQNGGLLSLGFFLALYFSINGVLGVIVAFNQTSHSLETRSTIQQYFISIMLMLLISGVVIISLLIIVAGSHGMNYLVSAGLIEKALVFYLIRYGKWLVIALMVFFVISLLYYLAPSRKERFRFISAGSSLATLLSLLASTGFNLYVNNFGNYNAVYGSIGTFIVLMMWFYLNALALLIGFELNASITEARQKKTLTV